MLAGIDALAGANSGILKGFYKIIFKIHFFLKVFDLPIQVLLIFELLKMKVELMILLMERLLQR